MKKAVLLSLVCSAGLLLAEGKGKSWEVIVSDAMCGTGELSGNTITVESVSAPAPTKGKAKRKLSRAYERREEERWR